VSNDRKAVYDEREEINLVKEGRSLIVVIGINDYVHSNKLKNAVQDAIGLQQAMIDKLGFLAPIPPLLDKAATKDAISSLVVDQLDDVVEENDNLIFFFAGHGTTRVSKVGSKEIETGYLVPVDAAQSWNDYVEIDSLLKNISMLPARHILVILDSCESGLALGQAMNSFRDMRNPQGKNRYSKDLNGRISRKVITSAQRDQLAKDNGPIQGHSLFTGTLINGFNWGKADLDGNGLISSSELGLFLQQQVGQASDSQQTPDFGSFHLDERGEMIISLRDQSFDMLKARAFAALQSGVMKDFADLSNQLILLKPLSPEALYLEYRLSFFEGDFDRAVEAIDKLLNLNTSMGLIPLSQDDIFIIQFRFNCWKSMLEIPNSEISSEIHMLVGDNEEKLEEVHLQGFGDLEGFLIQCKKIFQLRIKNNTNEPIHIYMIEIDENGLFEPINLWKDEDILLDGLPAGKEINSNAFLQWGSVGICEIRLFFSPKRLNFFLFPQAAEAKFSMPSIDIEPEDFNLIQVKSFYYSMTSKLIFDLEE
jgi:Caspase domain